MCTSYKIPKTDYEHYLSRSAPLMMMTKRSLPSHMGVSSGWCSTTLEPTTLMFKLSTLNWMTERQSWYWSANGTVTWRYMKRSVIDIVAHAHVTCGRFPGTSNRFLKRSMWNSSQGLNWRRGVMYVKVALLFYSHFNWTCCVRIWYTG